MPAYENLNAAEACAGLPPHFSRVPRLCNVVKTKNHFPKIIAVLLGSLAVWIWRNSRAASPSPHYRLLRKEGDFELREYPNLAVATTMLRGGKQEMNDSFYRLFQFISGENAAQEKIEMTTPVLMSRGSAPGSMSFILPAEIGVVSAPRPDHSDVRVETFPGGRFAVRRFAGNWSPELAQGELEKLRAWIPTVGLSAEGESRVAYYDPPWTPSFLRRNEVLCRVSQPSVFP